MSAMLLSRVGAVEVGGEVLGTELVLCDEAASEGWSRVSGYSSSKRWIMPSSVWSRKSRRPVIKLVMLIVTSAKDSDVRTVSHVVTILRLSNQRRLNPRSSVSCGVEEVL